MPTTEERARESRQGQALSEREEFENERLKSSSLGAEVAGVRVKVGRAEIAQCRQPGTSKSTLHIIESNELNTVSITISFATDMHFPPTFRQIMQRAKKPLTRAGNRYYTNVCF